MATEARRKKFIELIHQANTRKGVNAQILTNEKYDLIIKLLQQISVDGAKKPKDYKLQTRYQLLDIQGSFYLKKKGTELKYVRLEEVFDIIHSSHIETGHGGRNVLLKDLSKKFANISREQVMFFIQLCEECHLKKSKVRKSIVVKPIVSNEMNSRCQVSCKSVVARKWET